MGAKAEFIDLSPTDDRDAPAFFRESGAAAIVDSE
jgi:hypothetical protein